MWILTPGSRDFSMINLCDFVRLNVLAVPDTDKWELRAYKSVTDEEGVCIKVGEHAELEGIMVAMSLSPLRHPSFALTTPTFH